MAQHFEFDWKTADGLKIYGQGWSVDSPKAVIALVHGFAEHSSRYQHVAEFFTSNGFAVIAYDRRGHGKSEGKRAHTISYDALLDEIERLCAESKSLFADAPVILYGHSQGGNLVLNAGIRRKMNVLGIIATAPWIELAFQPSAPLVFVGKLMRKIMPGFTQTNQLDTGHLSRSPEVVKAYEEDPLVISVITSETGVSMLESAAWLLEKEHELPAPTLLMHGTGDQITSHDATKRFSSLAKGDTTFQSWNGLYHEIHNEPEQDEVLDFALNWIQSTLLS